MLAPQHSLADASFDEQISHGDVVNVFCGQLRDHGPMAGQDVGGEGLSSPDHRKNHLKGCVTVHDLSHGGKLVGISESPELGVASLPEHADAALLGRSQRPPSSEVKIGSTTAVVNAMQKHALPRSAISYPRGIWYMALILLGLLSMTSGSRLVMVAPRARMPASRARVMTTEPDRHVDLGEQEPRASSPPAVDESTNVRNSSHRRRVSVSHSLLQNATAANEFSMLGHDCYVSYLQGCLIHTSSLLQDPQSTGTCVGDQCGPIAYLHNRTSPPSSIVRRRRRYRRQPR